MERIWDKHTLKYIFVLSTDRYALKNYVKFNVHAESINS